MAPVRFPHFDFGYPGLGNHPSARGYLTRQGLPPLRASLGPS